MSDKVARFNQRPQDERQTAVDQHQAAMEPEIKLQIGLALLSNKKVMVLCPDGMQSSMKGCAIIVDILAKAQQVMASTINTISGEESRIMPAHMGMVPPLQG